MSKTIEEVREKCAAIEHERWSGWMKHLFSKCDSVSGQIPQWAVERWKRQMNTPYAELSQSEKDSDLREVDSYFQMVWDAAIAHVEGERDLLKQEVEAKEGDREAGWENYHDALEELKEKDILIESLEIDVKRAEEERDEAVNRKYPLCKKERLTD